MSFVLGVVLSAVTFFVWSAISWMALPWQRKLFLPFSDEERMAAILGEQAPATGIYGLPSEPVYPPGASKAERDGIDQQVYEKLQRGPLVFAVVSRSGFGSYPQMLARALVANLLVSLIFAWMLLQTAESSYFGRVLFLVLGSIAASVATRVPDWIWHKFPLRHAAVNTTSLAIGWLLAGMVLAAFVRGRGPVP
jgi:hypothetical protein